MFKSTSNKKRKTFQVVTQFLNFVLTQNISEVLPMFPAFAHGGDTERMNCQASFTVVAPPHKLAPRASVDVRPRADGGFGPHPKSPFR